MTTKAIIYVRVSTDEQAKGYSLSTQVQACKDFATERGYDVVATYSEDYSGATIDRPELNKVREHVSRETIERMVVYDIDRLARKSVYQMLIEEELRQVGTIIEFVIGQYEDTDEGRLQKQIRASIAEYEKAKILERSKRGKRGKAQGGYVLVGARPPYGYQVESEPHKAWFVIDEDEARIIHLVFQWYVYGDEQGIPMSIFGITSKLTEMGIPTRGDKQRHVSKKQRAGVWSDKMVRNILKNETYVGIWYYGKTKMISDGKESTRNGKNKRGLGKQVPRSRDEWISVEVPSIISRRDYEKAQERLLLNLEQAKRNNYHEYLLGRRLRCSVCGYSIVGMQRRVNNRYYRCNGAWRKPKVCFMPHFRVDLVDSIVWQWIKEILEDPEYSIGGLRGMQEDSIQANQALITRLKIIEEQLNEVEQQKSRLLDLYLGGDFPKEMLQERKARLEETIVNLQREQTDVLAHIQTQVISDDDIAEIEAFCADIRLRIDNPSFEVQRQIVEFLDVRGKLAIENDEKVVYVKCHLGQQRLSVARTSPLSSFGAIAIRSCAFLPIPPFR
jgi:site-specific DNA recombinase